MGLNKSNRTVNAGKNTVSALFNKMCILVLTFISRKFFIQYIGIEYLGINGLFSNVLTILSIADLGIGTAMNVSLYKPIAENNTQKLSALLHYFKKIYYLIAVCISLIGIGLLPFLKYIINMESSIPHLYLYYIIFVLKNAVSYLFAYKSAIITADQKNYIVNRIEVIIQISKVLLQTVVIVLFKQYLFYLLLDVFAVIVQNLVVSKVADNSYPFLQQHESLSKYEKKNLFKDIYSVFLYKISWSLLNGTDNILMSVIVGTIYVGMYSNYYTITNNIEMFFALLFTSLTASIGNLVATASSERRYNVFKIMQMAGFWIGGIIVISLFFLTQNFIELWLGKEFLFDNLTLVAIVLNVFFSTCMRPVWTFREGTGMYKQIRYIMFITAMLNLVLSIILGQWLGISGILFGTSISKILTYFWYEPNILFKNFFKMSAQKYYLDFFCNIGVLLFTAVLCYIPIYFIKDVSVISWLLKATICFVIVNIIYLLRYYKTEEFKELKNKINGLVKKKQIKK